MKNNPKRPKSRDYKPKDFQSQSLQNKSPVIHNIINHNKVKASKPPKVLKNLNESFTELRTDEIRYEIQNEERHKVKNRLLKDLYDENKLLKEKLQMVTSEHNSLKTMGKDELIEIVIKKNLQLLDYK